MTKIKCSNCGKTLLKGDKEYCEKYDETECSECRFHALNGTRPIEKYNAWLRKNQKDQTK